MRGKHHGGGVGRHPSFVLALLILASPQAGSFCAALALLQHTITTTTRPSCLLNGTRRCANKRPWKARLLRGPTFPILSNNRRVSSSRLLGEAGRSNSNVPASQIEAETQHLMSVPTIDLKLELQMRGVEHRDAFEKVDLARRLAEARASSPSAAANGPPSASTTTKGDDERAASDTLKSEEASPSSGGGGGNGNGRGGWKRNSSRSAPSTAEATQERAASQTAQEGEDGEGEDEDSLSARDVAAAMRMGKEAVTRELNGMGIAHSRLSDLAVLASQYASGKREARRDAEEARRFRAGKEVDRRVEAMRLSSLGRVELESRLRALGVRFSAQISDLDLAALLVEEGDGGGDGEHGCYGEERSTGRRGDNEGEEEEEVAQGKQEGKGSSGWERWTAGRWDTAASALSWKHTKKGEKEDKHYGYGGELGSNGETSPWGRRGGSDDEDGRSVQGDTDGNVSDDDELAAAAAAAAAATGGREKGSPSLQARADRMSSRDIMSALDDLGVRYRIPTPRSELQQAFVLALLRQREGTAGGEASRADGSTVDGAANGEIVPLSPYAAEEAEGPAGEYRRQMGFETYHSALRWARQLTFDDVLEELRYRGVNCNPRADFSYLTRLLADEVLADEELMEAEEDKKEGEYDAEVGMVMAMSAQDIIKELRAGGERVDVTLSKEDLAQGLVLMNARSRNGESQRPRPSVGVAGAAENTKNQSGSGTAYGRDRPEGRRRWRDQTQGGRGSNGFGSSSSSSGGGFGAIGDLLEFGDAEDGLRDDDALLELEAVARTVGGAAWVAVQEAAAVLTGTASGLFPEAFPERTEREDDAPQSEGARRTRGTQGRRREGARDSGPTRRARAVRERARGVRRAAASFAHSSANRAGLTVVRSAANGVLRGAEAAADWAGGGVLTREHVLLFVAAFCLVFKRGLGSSAALLVLIRGGRITMQKLMSEGWTARNTRTDEPQPAAAAGRGGREAPRPRNPARTSSSATRTAGTWETRRRSKTTRTNSRTKNRRPKGGAGSSKRADRGNRKGRERRKPLWEESDDDSDKGCVVM